MENQWIQTDKSCNQYRKDISETVFLFKEDRVVDPVSGETGVYESEINLDDYTWLDITDACESFGYTTQQVDDWINSREENALIAECLFELEN